MEHSNEGVLILAATNAPWHLDPAFRRPGRFDRILFVPPPDASARAAILRLLCQGKPQNDVDFEALAQKTEGFSGADLKAVVDVAVEGKLREALQPRPPSPAPPRPALPRPACRSPWSPAICRAPWAPCAPPPKSGSPPPATTPSTPTRAGPTTTSWPTSSSTKA